MKKQKIVQAILDLKYAFEISDYDEEDIKCAIDSMVETLCDNEITKETLCNLQDIIYVENSDVWTLLKNEFVAYNELALNIKNELNNNQSDKPLITEICESEPIEITTNDLVYSIIITYCGYDTSPVIVWTPLENNEVFMNNFDEFIKEQNLNKYFNDFENTTLVNFVTLFEYGLIDFWVDVIDNYLKCFLYE